jgi:hypothetical protein
MKLQSQTPRDTATGFQQQTQQNGTEQPKDVGQNESPMDTTLLRSELSENHNTTIGENASHAKRLKLDYEASYGKSDLINKQMAGLGGKASQQT